MGDHHDRLLTGGRVYLGIAVAIVALWVARYLLGVVYALLLVGHEIAMLQIVPWVVAYQATLLWGSVGLMALVVGGYLIGLAAEVVPPALKSQAGWDDDSDDDDDDSDDERSTVTQLEDWTMELR